MKYIGISGLARSGKDTVAMTLHKYLPHLPIIRFAEPIKEVSHTLFNDTEKETYVRFTDEMFSRLYEMTDAFCDQWQDIIPGLDPEKVIRNLRRQFVHVSSISPRIFQQTYGTEVWRYAHPDTFVKVLQHRYPEGGIIADVRFQNEVDMCDQMFSVSRNNRPFIPPHASEEQELVLPPSTHVIRNNGTLNELEKKICSLIHFTPMS